MRFLALFLLAFPAYAHEMTPAHPKLGPSHIEGVVRTELKMFNKRSDVEWYEVGVFDTDWNPVPFVTTYKVLRLPYLGHVKFDVYLRRQDAKRAMYVCSRSKLLGNEAKETMVASRICSRLQQG